MHVDVDEQNLWLYGSSNFGIASIIKLLVDIEFIELHVNIWIACLIGSIIGLIEFTLLKFFEL